MLIYKFYKFFKGNDNSVEECDISGEEYKQLIKICCKYSTVLSLNYYGHNAPLREILKKFESLTSPPCVSFVENHNHGGKIIYYDICPELCDILTSCASSIFDEWVPNWREDGPDNLTFYRADGTVFLNTVTHDNVITLRPRENEDVSNIISNKYWLSHDRDFRAYRAGFCVDCVPDAKTATTIAKTIFRNIKFPYKRELKYVETTFDQTSGKWNVIFARRDFAYSICKILVDKETATSEVFYETI